MLRKYGENEKLESKLKNLPSSFLPAASSKNALPTRAGLLAGARDATQRTSLYLAIGEHPADADALPDVIGQLQAIRDIHDLDAGRALLQEA